MRDCDHGFEYSDDGLEKEDVNNENHYNAKGNLADDEQAVSMEDDEDEWRFEAYLQAIQVPLYFPGNLPPAEAPPADHPADGGQHMRCDCCADATPIFEAFAEMLSQTFSCQWVTSRSPVSDSRYRVRPFLRPGLVV